MCSSRRALAVLLGGVVGGAAALIGAAAVAQTIAPQITPAGITVEVPVPPGEHLDVPSIVVRNTGSDELHTRMGVSTDGAGEEGWIRFDPAEFTLGAGESRVVKVRIEVPKDANLGPRSFRLRASAQQDAATEGIGIGVTAAVASILSLEVGYPPEGTSMTAAERTSVPSFIYLAIPVAVASGIGGWALGRLLERYEFVVRRRPAASSTEPTSEASAGDGASGPKGGPED